METPTYFLCASCGCEVRVDYCSPWFGLCEFCEERVQQAEKWLDDGVEKE
jgi:hypothetical protein